MADGMEQGMKALQHCGLTREDVMRSLGVQVTQWSNTPNPKLAARIQKLRKDGLKMRDIAKQMSVSVATVSKYCQ